MKFSMKILIILLLIEILSTKKHDEKPENDYDYSDEDSAMNKDSEILALINMNATVRPSNASASSKNGFQSEKTSIEVKHLESPGKKQNESHSEIPKATTLRRKSALVKSLTPYLIAKYMVDQFNHFRHLEIMSRIVRCDPTMKLNEMCETYAFNNHTYGLIREPFVEFQSFQQIFDALVDRLVVQKLEKFCSPGHWCINNLTQDDVRFTADIIRHRGRSFCSLNLCHHRLASHINTCPSISNRNHSLPTLRFLSMFCEMYSNPNSWNSPSCVQQTVHLLHLIYAFWPHVENCHHAVTSGSNGCTAECLTFDDVFRNVDQSCQPNGTFLEKVPALSWYRSISLKELCRHEVVPPRAPFISSVKNFVSSNVKWYRFHERPVYVVILVSIIVLIVISLALCIYLISRKRKNSHSRRFDDEYEYTRLQDASFELSNGTEIPNSSNDVNAQNNHILFDRNGNIRPIEQQRLLYPES